MKRLIYIFAILTVEAFGCNDTNQPELTVTKDPYGKQEKCSFYFVALPAKYSGANLNNIGLRYAADNEELKLNMKLQPQNESGSILESPVCLSESWLENSHVVATYKPAPKTSSDGTVSFSLCIDSYEYETLDKYVQ